MGASMRHRHGSSKIKYQHTIIQGLRKFLEHIEPWDEIQTMIPGEIHHTKSVQKFTLEIKYATQTGLKCIARSGSSVQEVFIVTAYPDVFKERLAEVLSNRT